MKILQNIFALFLTLLIVFNTSAQEYKEMIKNPSVNFYEVVKEGNTYFENRDKGKGSGWKGFQRWINNNEYKYYPSGDRSSIDPFFVENAYKEFLKNNPSNKDLFNNGWENLGPFNIGQVTGQYSVGLGRVETFYVHPTNDQVLYLGSRSGGFWKTNDGGLNWQGGSTDFLTASGVNTIGVSPTNSDSILINVRNSNNGTTHGIYRSVDGGDTWNITPFNPTNLGWGGLGTNREIYTIKYHPTIPNLIFVGTRDGLFRSDDNLATWTSVVASYDFTEVAFHPTNPMIIYASAKDNANIVYVSIDGGLNYSMTSLVGNGGARIRLSVSTDCDDCIYAASGSGVYKSTDIGSTFTMLSVPPTSADGFAVNDLDTSIVLIGALDAFTSTDGGVNFNQKTYWSLGNTNASGGNFDDSYHNSTDYIHADFRGAGSVNGVFYVNTDGFLVKSSDNGNNWEILSEGTAIRENYNLGVSQSNHYKTICGSQDNGTSIRIENDWLEFYGADGMEGFIHPLNDNWMMGSYQYGGRLRTKNGGLTNNVITPTNQDGYWIAPMFYDPNNQMTVFSLGKDIYKSDDFGNNWSNIGSPGFAGNVKFAVIAENNSDIIIATRDMNIEKSIDGGNTFQSIKNNLPNKSITDVAFDPNDDNVIMVTYGHYQSGNDKVYITVNGGTSWTNITYNLGDLPCRSIVMDHSENSIIYVGTEIGVYSKTMNNATWTLYNPDLPNVSVREMEIVWGTNTLRAASWGRGLWEYSLDNRSSFPSIIMTDLTDEVTDSSPKEGIPQWVTSEIQYDNTLSNVYLEWSTGTPTFGNVISMNNTTGDTWVSSSPLPDNPLGTKMFFKVFAVGNAGDTTETYKFQYTVQYNPNASVSSTEMTDLYSIHPNPISDFVYLDGENLENAEIVVLDNSGKTCDVIVAEKSNDQIKLDFTAFSSGIYFINVSIDEELTQVLKCVVK